MHLFSPQSATQSLNPPSWSLQFADAFFKPPAGLLDGNFNWLGAFDECINIHVNEANFKTNGKYCLVPVYMGNASSRIENSIPGSTEGLNLGICIPQSCSSNDLALLAFGVNDFIHANSYYNVSTEFNFFTKAEKMRCHNPELPYSDQFIIAIAVISVILALNLLSTLYDLIMRNSAKNTISRQFSFIDSSSPCPPRINASPSPINLQAPSGLMADSNSSANSNEQTNNERTHLLINKPPSMAVSPLSQHNSSYASINFNLVNATTSPKKLSTRFDDFLVSFSFVKNAEKLFGTNSGKDSARNTSSFGVIHGLRFFSIAWVILGHAFITPLTAMDNLMPILNYTRHFEFQVVNNALLAVDTFFVLSGFLVAYLALRQIDKFAQMLRASGKANRAGRWFGFFACFYAHRYLRLTPLLGFIIIVYTGLTPYLLDGPLWLQRSDANCVDRWWTNILFVNNFVDGNQECMGWTWYLAVDTQLFLIAPLPLLCFFWRPFLGWICAFCFVVLSAVTNAYISYEEGFTAAPLSGYYSLNRTVFNEQLVAFERNFFSDMYIMPWCRCAAWVIGLSLGCSLSRMPASFTNARLQSAMKRKVLFIFKHLVEFPFEKYYSTKRILISHVVILSRGNNLQ